MNGTVNQLVGSAKRKVGSITHNTHLQVEGIAQQGKGKVEIALGNAQDAIKKVVGDAELHIDGHVSVGLKKPARKGESVKRTVRLSHTFRAKKS
jgi:uncharacterized protein YjbJ (UPF0337 family)